MNSANRKKQKGFFLDKTYKSLYSHMGVWLWLHHHHWQTIFQQFCQVISHYIILSRNHHVHPYGKTSSSCCCCFFFFHNLSTQLYTISTLLTQINQCISSTTITHAFPYRKKAKHQTQMLANACKNAHNYEKPKYFSSFHSSMLSFSINMTSSQDITVMAGSNGNTRHSSLTKPMPMRKNLWMRFLLIIFQWFSSLNILYLHYGNLE